MATEEEQQQRNQASTSLPDHTFKKLLCDIEASALPRESLYLKKLCDDNESTYGEPGSLLRRQVQKRFDFIKRQSLSNYVKVLHLKSIPVGTATQRLLEEPQNGVEEPTTTTTVEEPPTEDIVDTTATPPCSDDEEEDLPTDLEATFEALSITEQEEEPTGTTNTPRPYKTMSQDHRHRPVTRSMGGYSTPPRPTPKKPSSVLSPPPAMVKTTTTPARTPSASVVVAQELTDDFFLASEVQLGTTDSPYIIHVNLTHPERNREFYIERVTKITHKAYERDGFHIRVPVAVPDFQDWEAKIPEKGKYGLEFNDRLIEIEGPSVNFWCRDTERYHNRYDCQPTKSAHRGTQLDIEADSTRQKSNWLLVFPEGVVLDNTVFSDPGTHVESGWNGMTVEPQETFIGKQLHGIVVYWLIAEIGGRRVDKVQVKPTPEQVFGG